MTTTNDEREALLAAAKAEYLTPLLAELDTAIIALGGKPDSPAWDDWDIADLLRMGDAARHVKKAYGATLTIELPKTQLKPGPEPMTAEEKMELYFDLKREGWSQDVYIGRKYVSRYAVQQAAKYCKENPDIFRQFQAKKLL